jgi:hypothetical protein
MIKTILTLVAKVLESKLVKSGLEATILKNQNYFTEAKKIWDMVDENFRISTTVEEKLKSKIEQFNEALLVKFPELSQRDIDDLRQSIAGEVNQDKEAVISNSDLLKQLQDEKTQLQTENAELKNKIAQIQSTVAVNTSSDVQQQTIQA